MPARSGPPAAPKGSLQGSVRPGKDNTVRSAVGAQSFGTRTIVPLWSGNRQRRHDPEPKGGPRAASARTTTLRLEPRALAAGAPTAASQPGRPRSLDQAPPGSPSPPRRSPSVGWGIRRVRWRSVGHAACLHGHQLTHDRAHERHRERPGNPGRCRNARCGRPRGAGGGAVPGGHACAGGVAHLRGPSGGSHARAGGAGRGDEASRGGHPGPASCPGACGGPGPGHAGPGSAPRPRGDAGAGRNPAHLPDHPHPRELNNSRSQGWTGHPARASGASGRRNGADGEP